MCYFLSLVMELFSFFLWCNLGVLLKALEVLWTVDHGLIKFGLEVSFQYLVLIQSNPDANFWVPIILSCLVLTPDNLRCWLLGSFFLFYTVVAYSRVLSFFFFVSFCFPYTCSHWEFMVLHHIWHIFDVLPEVIEICNANILISLTWFFCVLTVSWWQNTYQGCNEVGEGKIL